MSHSSSGFHFSAAAMAKSRPIPDDAPVTITIFMCQTLHAFDFRDTH
jgi:hypothetical protein